MIKPAPYHATLRVLVRERWTHWLRLIWHRPQAILFWQPSQPVWKWTLAIVVLVSAAYFGSRPSVLWLIFAGALIGGFVLLHQTHVGLLAIVGAALVVPLEIGTGTEVKINVATLLIPVMLALWLVNMALTRHLGLAPSRTTKPLLLFLLSGLLSLLVGRVLWDTLVPLAPNFLIVQLAQWAIFAFSAGVFWLVGNQTLSQTWLERLTFFFLLLAGALAIIRVLPGGLGVVNRFATIALIRAPFWALLTALAGGQILFNRKLTNFWRAFLLLTFIATLIYAFSIDEERNSNWVGAGITVLVLLWLRFPRWRWPMVGILILLLSTGSLWSAIYNFAGGDAKWVESGGSRLALSQGVIDLTKRNPITGLGPAAYRAYGKMQSIDYGQAHWVSAWYSSHNNYVDIFSHGGLLGLGLFLWFMGELLALALRLRQRYVHGFAAGYVNAMVAAWASIMALMLLADWFLPFIYNIGFPGFQASLLVWMFLGGLVALERWSSPIDVAKE